MLVFFTDTDTDITLSDAKRLGIKLISMPYIMDNKVVRPYEDFEEFDYQSFYNRLRKGEIPKTCSLNPQEYIDYFEPIFANGDDILYVHFSKKMSSTFNAMTLAIEELQEKYKERKFYTIDTLGIASISALIVEELASLYNSGKTIDELIKWSNEYIKHFAFYYFVDTLDFFAKSGRISNFNKIMGNLIGIKPIIYMNDDGEMINIGKERGTMKSIIKLANCYEELATNNKEHKVIITHSDSFQNAKKLHDLIKEKHPDVNIEIKILNPTAGCHSGPDGVGITFFAKHR